jgi:hypothetical protein
MLGTVVASCVVVFTVHLPQLVSFQRMSPNRLLHQPGEWFRANIPGPF